MQNLLEASMHLLPLLAASTRMKPPPHHYLTINDAASEVPATHEEVQHYMAMAKGRLNDAMESSIRICGIYPLDHGDR